MSHHDFCVSFDRKKYTKYSHLGKGWWNKLQSIGAAYQTAFQRISSAFLSQWECTLAVH